MKIEQVGSCARLSTRTRAALEGTYRGLTEGWTRGAYGAHMLESQCRAMLDDLRHGVAATCGW